MTVEVEVLKDSAHMRCRLTTLRLRYPRYIHSEVMTHRMFSRCASSTRAVPLQKQLANIEADMAVPFWTMNQAGMQGVPADEETAKKATAIWKSMYAATKQGVLALEELDIHKQNSGRAVEPWNHISVIVSSTDWYHFMDVRPTPKAEPTMCELAEKIRNALHNSVPERPKCEITSIKHSPLGISSWEDWHLPYMTAADLDELAVMLFEDNCKRVTQTIVEVLGEKIPNNLYLEAHTPAIISAARCARVSYLNHEGTRDLMKDLRLGLQLIRDHHWSPLEHVAEMANDDKYVGNFRGWIQLRKLLEPTPSGEWA